MKAEREEIPMKADIAGTTGTFTRSVMSGRSWIDYVDLISFTNMTYSVQLQHLWRNFTKLKISDQQYFTIWGTTHNFRVITVDAPTGYIRYGKRFFLYISIKIICPFE